MAAKPPRVFIATNMRAELRHWRSSTCDSRSGRVKDPRNEETLRPTMFDLCLYLFDYLKMFLFVLFLCIYKYIIYHIFKIYTFLKYILCVNYLFQVYLYRPLLFETIKETCFGCLFFCVGIFGFYHPNLWGPLRRLVMFS